MAQEVGEPLGALGYHQPAIVRRHGDEGDYVDRIEPRRSCEHPGDQVVGRLRGFEQEARADGSARDIDQRVGFDIERRDPRGLEKGAARHPTREPPLLPDHPFELPSRPKSLPRDPTFSRTKYFPARRDARIPLIGAPVHGQRGGSSREELAGPFVGLWVGKNGYQDGPARTAGCRASGVQFRRAWLHGLSWSPRTKSARRTIRREQPSRAWLRP